MSLARACLWLGPLTLSMACAARDPAPGPRRSGPLGPAAPARVPPSSFPDGECRCWSGRIVGNDSDVQATLLLCRQGATATGTLRWLSQRSGRSVRAVSGVLQGMELRLRDDRMLIDEPAPSWRFCLVEEYRLSLDDESGALAGGYRSPKCYDQARLAFSPSSQARCRLSILRQEPIP